MDVVARAAEDGTRIVTSANNEVLQSARAAAGGRMEYDKQLRLLR